METRPDASSRNHSINERRCQQLLPFCGWKPARMDNDVDGENLSDPIGRFLGMTAIEHTETRGADNAPAADTVLLEDATALSSTEQRPSWSSTEPRPSWSSTERRRSDMETRPDAGSRNHATDVCAAVGTRFRSVDGNRPMWTATAMARIVGAGR